MCREPESRSLRSWRSKEQRKEPAVKATVVYESVYGNTLAVAEAIAEGLGGAEVVAVHRAANGLEDSDLLIVGGPTHMHGMTTTRSRQLAVEAVHEDGAGHVEREAAAEPGLRAWIRDLAGSRGGRAAAFDTRADKSPWLTGAASRGIAKRLRRRGYEVVATESFLVEDSEGPLAEGELDRARAWGAELASSMPAAAPAEAS
jgi:flavodoxin